MFLNSQNHAAGQNGDGLNKSIALKNTFNPQPNLYATTKQIA